jgi:Holliday junction resolvase
VIERNTYHEMGDFVVIIVLKDIIMPNRNYINGANRERKIVNEARKNGCLAFRSAGSHSPIDVFNLNPKNKTICLIQCKPKSMSDNKKEEIKKDLIKYNGTYVVDSFVV